MSGLKILPPKNLQSQPKKRQRKNKRIETVEQAAVTGQQIAGVFHADAAFEHTFHQVAEGAENSGHHAQREPLYLREVFDNEGQTPRHQHRANPAADSSFPGLIRRNTLEEFSPSELRADEVGHRVVCPDEDQQAEDAEGQEKSLGRGD